MVRATQDPPPRPRAAVPQSIPVVSDGLDALAVRSEQIGKRAHAQLFGGFRENDAIAALTMTRDLAEIVAAALREKGQP